MRRDRKAASILRAHRVGRAAYHRPMDAPASPAATLATALPRPTVFFISDGTGITAETFGNSILSQFAIKPRHLRRPFIDTPDKAHQVVREINHTAEHDGRKPIAVSYTHLRA